MAGRKGHKMRKDERTHVRIGVNIIGYNGRKTLPKLDEEVGLNISIGGMLIECSKKLVTGTSLKLKVMLTFNSSYKIILVPAKIMWVNKTSQGTYYLGCKFTRLKTQDKTILKRYIKENQAIL